jgi:hypothetical protein
MLILGSRIADMITRGDAEIGDGDTETEMRYPSVHVSRRDLITYRLP